MTRRTLFVDIETFSTVSIKKVNVYRYAEDPAFQILMAAWSLDGSPVVVETDPDAIREIPGLTDPEVLKVAHNAAFERVCFSRFLGLETGEYLDPDPWHDTQAVAAERGYPQSLEVLAHVLRVAEKDSAGSALIRWFCVPDPSGRRRLPEDHPEKWAAFVEYCRQDVATLIEVHEAIGGFPTRTERDLYRVDQRINDRGLAVDLDLARSGVAASADNTIADEVEISLRTGIANPGSRDQMLRWLRDQPETRSMPDLKAETVSAYLEDPDGLDEEVRDVLRLRQGIALASGKKFSAAIDNVCSDGRLRGSLRFFAAHTGRWGGRGVQPQNLPRDAFETDAETEAAIVDLKMGEPTPAHTLRRLVRPLFTGPLTIVDYAAIEARVIAWLAGEAWALEAFEAGRDIYVETAERMSTPTRKLTRSHGKVAVLALGYGGAVGSLRAMGAEGDDHELATLVRQWRAANPAIVKFWYGLQDAFEDGGRVGRVEIHRSGERVRMKLPSGRSVTYHGVRWERWMGTDPITGRPTKKEGWRYADPRNPAARIPTYSGRIAENATQAVARDLLAEALLRLDAAGLPVVGHVHDEVIVAGTHDVDEIAAIMCEPTRWSAGLPIDAEGFVSPRYRKG